VALCWSVATAPRPLPAPEDVLTDPSLWSANRSCVALLSAVACARRSVHTHTAHTISQRKRREWVSRSDEEPILFQPDEERGLLPDGVNKSLRMAVVESLLKFDQDRVIIAGRNKLRGVPKDLTNDSNKRRGTLLELPWGSLSCFSYHMSTQVAIESSRDSTVQHK